MNSLCPRTASDETDILLMERVKDGDMAAFETLVETHQSRVIGTVAKMLGDGTDHEDIAQQVFLRVWHSSKRYQPAAKFTTWLFKITRNLVLNELRRRKRHPATTLETPHLQTQDPHALAPDSLLLEEELQQAIQQAIDALPELQRMAIILRRFEELPYEDIAEVLEVSVPAVKSLLFRARTELRDRLRLYLEAVS